MGYNPYIHNRHSIRLRGYNYASTGAYFITICCQNREHIFGEIADGKMILNEYGKIAHNEWINTAKIRKNINLHEFVIMPNHVHGIIEIKTHFRGVCNTPLRMKIVNTLQSPSNTIGAIIRGYKSAVTNQIQRRGVLHTPLQAPNTSPPIWQRNYHEHIIRNETEHMKIEEYIRNNPILWKKDRFNICGWRI